VELAVGTGGNAFKRVGPCELTTLQVSSDREAPTSHVLVTAGEEIILDTDIADVHGELLVNRVDGAVSPVEFMGDVDITVRDGTEGEVVTVKLGVSS